LVSRATFSEERPNSAPTGQARGLKAHEVRRDIAAWLAKWQGKYPRLCDWVESNIEETLTYYRLPLAHHKHMKSTTCSSG
jgi:transposase-like protein